MNKEQWKDKYLELAQAYKVLYEEHEKLRKECYGQNNEHWKRTAASFHKSFLSLEVKYEKLLEECCGKKKPQRKIKSSAHEGTVSREIIRKAARVTNDTKRVRGKK